MATLGNSQRYNMALQTPHDLGYRMPAEWERHTRTWLAWPHNRNDWPGKFGPIPWVYAEFIRQLALVERVGLIVRDDAMQDQATEILARNGVRVGQIDFLHARTNRIWTRDSGPIFVVKTRPDNGGSGDPASRERGAHAAAPVQNQEILQGANKDALGLVDWKFNAWAKYKNHGHDNKLPSLIADYTGVKRFEPKVKVNGKMRHIVLEGGSIDVNGLGTLLTTEECLLSDVQCRNPGVTREQYERIFHDYLGITNTIWLGHGIVGDDTHGHVDDLARFVTPDTVVLTVEKDASDPNYPLLQDNLVRLKAARDQQGKGLNVVALPMPKPVVFEGERLPASYANFLIANELVLVPTFNDANDRIALNILAELFPRRSVVGIHCTDFVWGLGTLHCASQQEPAV